jgi:hypothetical protein
MREAMDIRQFKLTNSDEIICEVVEWDNESDSSIVVRKALQLVSVNDDVSGIKYYSFRSWAALQESINDLILLNAEHILSEACPSGILIEYYAEAILQQSKHLEEDAEEIKSIIGPDSDLTYEIEKKVFH